MGKGIIISDSLAAIDEEQMKSLKMVTFVIYLLYSFSCFAGVAALIFILIGTAILFANLLDHLPHRQRLVQSRRQQTHAIPSASC